MNLSEALDAALPEIPKVRMQRSRPPRLDPDLVIREDVLDGVPIVGVFQRGKGTFYRFSPAQWTLALLFDGTRSYDEISSLYEEQNGVPVSAEDIRAFAESMEESGFWFKTSQEKNLALSERLSAQRSRRAQRTSKLNLVHISFSAWDPDRYLTWMDRHFGRIIYNRWSVLAVVSLFVFETVVFINNWNILGPDIPLYFNFTHKSLYDVAEFWLLLFGLGFIHETGHGLTCKHFGGQVHNMGLMFLYLTPAFFVDCSESWVSASRLQRLATIIAGIWIEMTICGLAMIVWIHTAAGNWLHDFTYKIILLTGLAVVVMNLNPLLKLDGYYFLTEFLGIPELKERSTAFVSGWFQNRVLRLPVEVPSIPRRRAPLFVTYALISGAYSYMMLYFVIRLSYNVTSKLLAEFALIPAGALAFAMFRSRLNSLRSVIVQMWKRNFGESLRMRPRTIVAGAALVCLLFIPLWRDREGAYFVVEPVQPATLHAAVTGRVNAILVREGEFVRAGQPLLRMTSANASSMHSSAEAAASNASFLAIQSELRGQSVGTAAADQEAAGRSRTLARDVQSSLQITAPFDGIVLTEDPGALLDQSVSSGQPLLTLAANGPRMVRVFVPVGEMDRVHAGDEVALAPLIHFTIPRLTLAPMDGEPVPLPRGIIASQAYAGIVLPTFYSARMSLATAKIDLPLGAAGPAIVFGERRSLLGRAGSVVINLFRAHVW
ncbi:MAG: HlyD family efflux transporter periplasmic adaptor subunit [Terracidiphilus sp.]|jgi:putative peptide zinc metalloprotease protein